MKRWKKTARTAYGRDRQEYKHLKAIFPFLHFSRLLFCLNAFKEYGEECFRCQRIPPSNTDSELQEGFSSLSSNNPSDNSRISTLIVTANSTVEFLWIFMLKLQVESGGIRMEKKFGNFLKNFIVMSTCSQELVINSMEISKKNICIQIQQRMFVKIEKQAKELKD